MAKVAALCTFAVVSCASAGVLAESAPVAAPATAPAAAPAAATEDVLATTPAAKEEPSAGTPHPSEVIAPPPTPAPAAAPPPAKAPYSLPWQLRPAAAVNVVRSDTSMAFQTQPPGSTSSATTIVTTLLASYKVTPELAPMVRVAYVTHSKSGSAFVNPAVGATYAMALPNDLRLALFLGVTAPIGQGGGNSPDPEAAQARNAGILARSAMDNALFAVNDLTVFPGVGLAWVAKGFTVQVETTLLQLTRVRGAEKQAESSKTNLTAGVHVGYFLIPELSVGAELRHQRWLSTPDNVAKNSALRDTTTVAFGVRGHVKIGGSNWIRPGLSYARGLDAPLNDMPIQTGPTTTYSSSYNIFQLDIPFYF